MVYLTYIYHTNQPNVGKYTSPRILWACSSPGWEGYPRYDPFSPGVFFLHFRSKHPVMLVQWWCMTFLMERWMKCFFERMWFSLRKPRSSKGSKMKINIFVFFSDIFLYTFYLVDQLTHWKLRVDSTSPLVSSFQDCLDPFFSVAPNIFLPAPKIPFQWPSARRYLRHDGFNGREATTDEIHQSETWIIWVIGIHGTGIFTYIWLVFNGGILW